MKNFLFSMALMSMFVAVTPLMHSCKGKDDAIDNPDPNNTSGSGNIYVGVAAFNSNVLSFPISNNTEAAKSFIDNLKNDVDATALCYAVSKSVTMFADQKLPVLDKTFVVAFTDGYDNYSHALYQNDGRPVIEAEVYNVAASDLSGKTGMNAYSVGMGNEAKSEEANMRKLVRGSGTYNFAQHSSQLGSVFQEIAQNVLTTAKNYVLVTQNTPTSEADSRLFKVIVTGKASRNATTGYEDVVYCKLGSNHTLTITTPGKYVSFTTPAVGVEDGIKLSIPMNNMSFTVCGAASPYIINSIKVEVFRPTLGTYKEDPENGSASSSVSKNIGVVLTLDCSNSLGEAFGPLKSAANDFINTLITASKNNQSDVVEGSKITILTTDPCGNDNGNNNGGNDGNTDGSGTAPESIAGTYWENTSGGTISRIAFATCTASYCTCTLYYSSGSYMPFSYTYSKPNITIQMGSSGDVIIPITDYPYVTFQGQQFVLSSNNGGHGGNDGNSSTLNPPSNVSAIMPSGVNAVVISWDTVRGASVYAVQGCTSTNTCTTLTTSVSGTSYTNYSLAPNYSCYRVKAVNNGGESAYSDCATVQSGGQSSSDSCNSYGVCPPTGITAIMDTNTGYIGISWNANERNPYETYEVYYCEDYGTNDGRCSNKSNYSLLGSTSFGETSYSMYPMYLRSCNWYHFKVVSSAGSAGKSGMSGAVTFCND